MTHGAFAYPASAGGPRDSIHGAFLIAADGACAAGSRDVLDDAVVQGDGARAAGLCHVQSLYPALVGGGTDACVAMVDDV